MSSDSEYEEEEIYVFADFGNQLMPQEINSNAIKIIGIENDHPIAELDGNIFQGTINITAGTNIFFEKDTTENEAGVDTLFEDVVKQKYKYLAKSYKTINFKRIYVNEKKQEENNEDKEQKTDSKPSMAPSSLELNISYEDAIRQFPSLKNAN